jgi:hypothetical protein
LKRKNKQKGGLTQKYHHTGKVKNVAAIIGILLSLILGVLAGCSDEPTSVGIGLLHSEDLAKLDSATITAATGTSILKRINTGNSPNLLVGRSSGYVSSALLKFTAIPDSLKDATVDTLRLVLREAYRFSPPENILSFEAHKLTQGWTETGVTWDSITTASYDPTVLGRFENTVADSDSVVVDLNPSLGEEWLQLAGTGTIYGIILVPTPGSNGLVGFHSFQSADVVNFPTLYITYTRGSVHQTLGFVLGQDAHVADVDQNLVSNPNLFYVQSGVAYRTKLTFDLSAVPQHAGIHKAVLNLTRDKATTNLDSQSSDSLVSHFLLGPDSVLGSSAALGQRVNPDSDVYSFTITGDVQRWSNGRTNLGFQIKALNEISTLGLFTLYSPSAEPEKRPRLKVFYSQLP